MSDTDYKRTLEISAPLATCGHCRFATELTGKFTVEDGRLVWRGDADVQPRRGPSLESCSESSEVPEVRWIEVEEQRLSDQDVAALRATAKAAQDAEMRQVGMW